jgi:hypothetical protein
LWDGFEAAEETAPTERAARISEENAVKKSAEQVWGGGGVFCASRNGNPAAADFAFETKPDDVKDAKTQIADSIDDGRLKAS